MSLEDARLQAEKGALSACLRTLLAAWRASPNRRIADAIDAISQRVATSQPPLDVGSGTIQKAWLKRAAQQDPADLDLLLETLVENVLGRLAVLRLTALLDWPDDPRLCRLLVEHLRCSPWRKRSSGDPYALVAVDLLVRSNSPESHAALRSLAHSNRGRGWPSGRAVGARLIAVADALPEASPTILGADALATCDTIIRAAQAPAAPTPSLVMLSAAVNADPDDLDTRAVLADALIAQGKPRGTFISMQLARSVDATPSRAEVRLLKQYEREWMGPLEAIAAKSGHVWRNGALHHLRIARRVAPTAHCAEWKAWSTVRVLDLSIADISGDWTRIMRGPNARFHTVLGLRHRDAVLLQADGVTVPWTTISGIRNAEDPIAALGRLDAPHLRHYDLTWSVHRPDAAWLTAITDQAPSMTRLDVGAPAAAWSTFVHFPNSLNEVRVFRSNGNGGRRGWFARFEVESTTVEVGYLGGERGANPVSTLRDILHRQSPGPFERLRCLPSKSLKASLDWSPVAAQAHRLGLRFDPP